MNDFQRMTNRELLEVYKSNAYTVSSESSPNLRYYQAARRELLCRLKRGRKMTSFEIIEALRRKEGIRIAVNSYPEYEPPRYRVSVYLQNNYWGVGRQFRTHDPEALIERIWDAWLAHRVAKVVHKHPVRTGKKGYRSDL
jgi:hypothetical protein